MFYEFYIFFKCQIYKNGMGKTKIGIDCSINSTSVCIIEEGKKPIFYIIVPKMTKKMNAVNYGRICYFTYDKIEKDVTSNTYLISKQISQIITNYIAKTKDIEVNMEDISLGSKGRSIIDLSILSGSIRCMLMDMGIKPNMIPITTWKKSMIANAFADKETIIESGRMLDQELYDQVKDVKKDDIFDSMFIALYD